jgi:hypothetical protein
VDRCWLELGELAEGAVRPGGVVVPQVLGQHLSHMVLVDDQQPVEELSLVLGEYIDHYNSHRPHWSLQQEPPAGRARSPGEVTGMRVLRRDRLGSLIHEYAQVA